MARWFCDYWRIVIPPKSLAEIDAERWLLVCPLPGERSCQCRPFFRYYILIAAALVQFVCGVLFSMTIISKPFDLNVFGASTNNRNAQLTIESSVAIALAMAFVGPANERRGPRWSMLVGSSLAIVGLCAIQIALWARIWAPLVVGCIGCGLGYGFLVIAAVSTVQKWYPDLRGSALGVSMLGFGAGQIAWNAAFDCVRDHLADEMVLNTTFLFVILLLSPLLAFGIVAMRTPPSSFRVHGHDMHGVPTEAVPSSTTLQDDYYNIGMTLVNYSALTLPRRDGPVAGTERAYHEQVRGLTLLQCIFSTDFLCLVVASAALACTGLLYAEISDPTDADRIPRWFNTTSNENVRLHADIAGLLSRVVCPMLSDAISKALYWNPAFARKVVFLLLLLLPAVSLPLLLDTLDDFARLKTMIYIAKTAANGGFAVIGCFLTDLYGVYNMSTMYGLVLAGWSLGSVVVAVRFSGDRTDYFDQVQLIWVLCLVGFCLMVFVRTDSMDRFYHGYQLSICGKTVLQIPFKRRPEASSTVMDPCSLSMATLGRLSSKHQLVSATSLSKTMSFKHDGAFFIVRSDSEASVGHLNV
ncbi:hypothetical protein SPRG_15769 [Saprolegnia parasitica CBS 223.65]|uniref:Major facilitator superfamily (MFS) profile domain-containing protein n=1 Tax=Saprolegnia parasitica (strain CBS 223.65) TaxID=695850 RepID=A0A067BWE2_SAPPC|nr:hypothetical protein SPRG_15769 [Saprolegnia parasitica CBS 223.65]KDO18927.1 hypothetical protein SPRG_15769 [Saprolegnia parasitica CBS 223.65]|eukprot:XP_012210371.1 hypothetical protein SPRG_15769 [Saprolegnia parasitica CBS 223.65]